MAVHLLSTLKYARRSTESKAQTLLDSALDAIEGNLIRGVVTVEVPNWYVQYPA